MIETVAGGFVWCVRCQRGVSIVMADLVSVLRPWRFVADRAPSGYSVEVARTSKCPSWDDASLLSIRRPHSRRVETDGAITALR
jgi:hypothetical protein